MNPQDSQAPVQPISNNSLANAESGAQLVCDIRRHPIGIIGVYAGAGLLIIGLAVIVFGIAPGVFTGYKHSQIILIGVLVLAVVTLITAGFVIVAHKVYWGNRWIVSTESITQVVKNSLFNKQTSQLSLGHLEDLTAEQHGLLARIFNYGTLSAETAAATDKFTFPLCPSPNDNAQKILAAREAFEQTQRSQPEAAATATETDYHGLG